MIIYHGSDHIIKEPVYKGSKQNNDYGYGFYCTAVADLAREWSASPGRDGYLNAYDFYDDGLKVLDLSSYSIMTWLAILLQNRTFQLNTPLSREACKYIISEFNVDYEKYDVIKGYRADDSYFSFARDFVNNAISIDQLSAAMHLGELGEQIVLKSRRSFDNISFVNSEEVDGAIWYPKREQRNEKAKNAYRSSDKSFVRGKVYMIKILEEEMKRDDARLQ